MATQAEIEAAQRKLREIGYDVAFSALSAALEAAERARWQPKSRDHGTNAEECAHLLRSWAKSYREAPEELRFPSDRSADFFAQDLEAAANELDKRHSPPESK